MPTDAGRPLVIEVTRGPLVESRHLARACAVDASGRTVAAWGDAEAPVYPRSANKALIAIPFVETGAAAAYGLGAEELALACASHHGQPLHTRRVAAWLARIGCTPDDLECGPQVPADAAAAAALARRGIVPGALYNNCSGKHAAMLTTARHHGETLAGYTGYDHPVQRRVTAALGEMAGLDLQGAPWGVDGCSIPTIGVPLERLALAMARVARPDGLPAPRAAAVAVLAAAWGAYPMLVGGRDSFDTRLMRLLAPAVLVKSGAEGVCCAVVRQAGLGIALKVEDGGGRAAGVGMLAVLDRLGLIPPQAARVVRALARPAIRNRRDRVVGHLQPV
jgi:L-asparaginase II